MVLRATFKVEQAACWRPLEPAHCGGAVISGDVDWRHGHKPSCDNCRISAHQKNGLEAKASNPLIHIDFLEARPGIEPG